MADDETPQLFIRLDEGGVNVRILKRQIQADFRRVESASVKLHVRFGSPEGKRLFVRSFHSFQLLTHFILTIGRINLDDDRIRPVEDLIRAAVDRVSHHLDLEMDKAEELFKAHGVTQLASFDTKPLELRVPVLFFLLHGALPGGDRQARSLHGRAADARVLRYLFGERGRSAAGGAQARTAWRGASYAGTGWRSPAGNGRFRRRTSRRWTNRSKPPRKGQRPDDPDRGLVDHRTAAAATHRS